MYPRPAARFTTMKTISQETQVFQQDNMRILKYKISQRHPQTKEQLMQEWEGITVETLDHLVSSMPKRLAAVIYTKMISVSLIVFALWITAASCVTINATCDEKYANITPEHTMCKSMNEECHFLRRRGQVFREQLLRTHNLIRNSIRRHVGKKYHLATNMEFMHWDEELYAMARMHSLQCVDEPDCNLCHQIGDFPVEQNFAVRTFKRSEVADNGAVRRFQTVIKKWAAELQLYDRDIVKNFSFKEGLPTHWTNILRATTLFVGCASMNFIEDDPDTFKEVYICNYGPANLTEGEEIYKTGKKPCSECEDGAGCDLEFKRLCYITEEGVNPMTEEIVEEGVSGTEMYPEEEIKVVTMTAPYEEEGTTMRGMRWIAWTGKPWTTSTGKPWMTGRPWTISTGKPWVTGRPWTTGKPWMRGRPWTISTGKPWMTGRPWTISTGKPWVTGRPWTTSTGNPWMTGRPWTTLTGNPWMTGRPWTTSTGNPWTTGKPWTTLIRRTWMTGKPWSTSTGMPWTTSTGKPRTTWTGRTWATGKPWSTSTGNPWTTGKPWTTSTGRTWTTGKPWSTSTGMPWTTSTGKPQTTWTGRTWTTGMPWITSTGKPWSTWTGRTWATGKPWSTSTGKPWTTSTGKP